MTEIETPADKYIDHLQYELATTHYTGGADGRGTMTHEEYMDLLLTELKRVCNV